MECKVVYVENIEMPYKIKCAMIEPMKFKKYNKNAKKREDKELIREYEEEER